MLAERRPLDPARGDPTSGRDGSTERGPGRHTRSGRADANPVRQRRLLLSEPQTELAAFLARPHARLVLDVGCGDARATARLAAREPGSLVVGMDANLDAAERVARRARRAPEKGGLPNLMLVRAAADRLPPELAAKVDELRIDLPWGSLLEGVLAPDGEVMRGVARALAPSGAINIILNASALPDDLDGPAAELRLRQALDSAGLSDVHVGSTGIRPETAWGKRLAGGQPLEVIVAQARSLAG